MSADESALTPQNWPLAQLPGLSLRDQQLLQRAGLTTTLQLWQLTQDTLLIETLAARLLIPQRQLLKWISLADLARVPAVGCTYSGLLLHVGIQSVEQLSQSSPAQLHQHLLRLQVMMMRRRDLCPSASQVVRWIHEAQRLPVQPSPQSRKGSA
ncbi:MAG: DUF4332 domain-containing protein [Synechococcaceae cyanobacterium SM2_3_1]|nr:DUF4332 domain-containing protein [Synechococcaceae cyanobacterium SM2_3_1]